MFLLPAKKGIKCSVAISQGPATKTTTIPIKCKGAGHKKGDFQVAQMPRYSMMGGDLGVRGPKRNAVGR